MPSRESTCPICGALEELPSERYVNRACQTCQARANDTAGHQIVGYNTSIGGVVVMPMPWAIEHSLVSERNDGSSWRGRRRTPR